MVQYFGQPSHCLKKLFDVNSHSYLGYHKYKFQYFVWLETTCLTSLVRVGFLSNSKVNCRKQRFVSFTGKHHKKG